jgi:RNA polymerase sigma-70 factor (ECF subfamily)
MDPGLVVRSQQGDREALGALVTALEPNLYTYLLRKVNDEHLAQDLMQEVLMRVVRSIGTYRPERPIESWVFTIAANLCRDYYRNPKRGQSLDAIEDGLKETWVGEGPQDAADREEWKAKLPEAVGRLPPEQKEVVLLRVYGGMSFQEIADAVGCPINTALGRMRYAILNLRKYMGVEIETRP